MQRDLTDLKKLTMELMKSGNTAQVKEEQASLIKQIYDQPREHESQLASFAEEEQPETHQVEVLPMPDSQHEVIEDKYHFAEEIQEEESLSLQDKELELIKKSLEKYGGKRKDAARELGISERTLYRKIKQFNL